jgi:hypothetical protein
MQEKQCPTENSGLCQVAFLGETKVTTLGSGEGVEAEIGEDVVEGGDGPKRENGEGVEERVETDHDTEEDDLESDGK